MERRASVWLFSLVATLPQTHAAALPKKNAEATTVGVLQIPSFASGLPSECPAMGCASQQSHQGCDMKPSVHGNETEYDSWTDRCTSLCGAGTVGCTGDDNETTMSVGRLPPRCPFVGCNSKDITGMCGSAPRAVGNESYASWTDKCSSLCGADSGVGCTTTTAKTAGGRTHAMQSSSGTLPLRSCPTMTCNGMAAQEMCSEEMSDFRTQLNETWTAKCTRLCGASTVGCTTA